MTGTPERQTTERDASAEALAEIESLLGPALRRRDLAAALPAHADLESVALASLGLASAAQRARAAAVLRASPELLIDALVEPEAGEGPAWAPLAVPTLAPTPAAPPRRVWWQALGDWLGPRQTAVAWGVALVSSVLLLVAAVRLSQRPEGASAGTPTGGAGVLDVRRMGAPAGGVGGAVAQPSSGDSLSVLVERTTATGAPRSLGAVSGQRLRDADQLRVRYSARRPGRLSLAWIDDRGSVTVVRPGTLAPSAEIGPGRDQAVEPALRVTPGSGCEWLVAVFSDGDLDPDYLVQALRHTPRKPTVCGLELPGLPGARHVEVMSFRR